MKTSLLLVSTLLFCTLYGHGQDNTIYYGASSNTIGVVFVDTNLSTSAKASIVADLRTCSREWGKGELRMRNKGDSVGYIDNSTRCPHYPENLEFPENVVSNGVDDLAVQIPKKLSDAYTNALAFAAANSNIVAAAYEFVAFVSSSNFFSTVASNTIHNYVLVKEMTGSYYQSEFSNIIEGLFQHPKYYLPSLLGFYHSSDGPGTNNLYMTLPTKTNPGHGYEEWGGIPAVWHDNRWKICIGYEWVP